jgi:hypothetical protein
MKIKKQGLMAILLLAILISFVSLGAAAPVVTSESAIMKDTVKFRKKRHNFQNNFILISHGNTMYL